MKQLEVKGKADNLNSFVVHVSSLISCLGTFLFSTLVF